MKLYDNKFRFALKVGNSVNFASRKVEDSCGTL